MSRTRKGSKGIGWEPWTNIRDKEQQKVKDLGWYCEGGQRIQFDGKDLGECTDCRGKGCRDPWMEDDSWEDRYKP